MAASNDAPSLPRAARTGALALLLLVIAGLRHHLVWGESQHLPFSLRPFLDAFETGCLLGFAWLGARAWMHGMRAVAAAPAGARRLVVASLPLLALAIAVPPFLTTDITDYVMRGRILGLHGANPYLQVAADFPQDPFVAFGDSPWKAFPLPYGPIVADVQGAVAWIAHLFSFLPPLGELVVAIVLLKVVFAVCLVGSALIARGVWARVRPGEQDVAFVCLLWNPLLLNEALAQAHNESLVLLPTMLAVGASVSGRAGRGAFALGLAVLTKIVPVLLGLPLLAAAVRQRRVAAWAIGAGAALLVFAFYWWRFFTEPGSLEFLRRQNAMTGPGVVWALSVLAGVTVGSALVAGRAVLLGLVLAAAALVWRRDDAKVLLAACATIMASLVCFGLGSFAPWYHVWWVPLALLVDGGYVRRFAWFASVAAAPSYVVWTATRTLDTAHQVTQIGLSLAVPAVAALFLRPPGGRPQTAPPPGP
jgi:hypothetical protein